MAFDICTICQHQDNKGKCTKPGYCCDTSEDFIFKPVYAAAPDMYEALKELVDLMQGVIDGDYKPDSFTLQPARQALAKAEGRE